MRKFVLGFLFAGALALGVPGAWADGFLYGSDGFTSDLVLIDTADGSSSVVGNMAGLSVGVGLAYNPNTDTMYTRDFDTLFTVDYSNANTTEMGASGDFITALAFSTDYSTLYSFDQGTGDFYTVDPSNGNATFVGNTGLSTPLDMTMSAGGVLYAATIGADIYTINSANAAAALVWSSVDSRGLTSIQFDAVGNLYGVTLSDDILVEIDLSDGSVTDVGGPIIRQDIRGMAFVPEPAGLSILAVGAALLGIRRRR